MTVLQPQAPDDLYIDKLQAELDAMPRSDGILHGTNEVGGRIKLRKGTITTSRTLYVSSGQVVEGDAAGNTILRYLGPPGTAAIVTRSNFGHGYAQRPVIAHMSIDPVKGGHAIINEARVLQDARFEDLILNGPAYLPGENYFISFRDVDLSWVGSVPSLYAECARLSLDGLHTNPNGDIPAGTKPPPAVIQVKGFVEVKGCTRLEGPVLAPYLRVSGNPGELSINGMVHFEPHRKGTFIEMDRTRFSCDATVQIIGAPDTPWVLTNGSTAWVQKSLDFLRADATSSVYVNGVKVATQPVQ